MADLGKQFSSGHLEDVLKERFKQSSTQSHYQSNKRTWDLVVVFFFFHICESVVGFYLDLQVSMWQEGFRGLR